ncbi:MAG: hypothetical protein ACK5GV_11925 [Bacteroidota bacterium]|jgi:hypothetical protein
MPLPKIDVITYTTTIPSTKEEIKIRPFSVKEQKILLTAVAGQDPLEMSNSVRQVINNCIVTSETDVDKLEVFDLEYLMLQLRIISVGETTKVAFSGIEDSACDECKKVKEIEINLKDVKVDFEHVVDRKIKITDSVGAFLKYPDHKALAAYSKHSSEPNAELKLLWSCVESVYDENSVTSTKDVTVEEGIAFLEALTTQQFKMLEKFLETMPQVSHKLELRCSACGFTQNHILRGIDTFLA